jgi:hypothetical protein
MKTFALIAVTGFLAGCGKSNSEIPPKTTDFGTGLNAVERTYARSAVDLVEPVTASLKSYGLSIERDVHDNMGGEIVARRADGHQVTAKLTSVDQGHTNVSIRVAPGNKNLAEMIQDRVAEKVGALDAK